MRTYRVLDFDWLYFNGAVIAGAGAVFLLLIGAVGHAWLPGLGVAALVWLIVGHYVGRQVHEIRLAGDGTVEFGSVLGARRAAAGSIRSVEGRTSREEDGDVSWWINFRLARGKVEVRNTGEAAAFVADLVALNPAIDVTGRWPGVPSLEPTRASDRKGPVR